MLFYNLGIISEHAWDNFAGTGYGNLRHGGAFEFVFFIIKTVKGEVSSRGFVFLVSVKAKPFKKFRL